MLFSTPKNTSSQKMSYLNVLNLKPAKQAATVASPLEKEFDRVSQEKFKNEAERQASLAAKRLADATQNFLKKGAGAARAQQQSNENKQNLLDTSNTSIGSAKNKKKNALLTSVTVAPAAALKQFVAQHLPEVHLPTLAELHLPEVHMPHLSDVSSTLNRSVHDVSDNITGAATNVQHTLRGIQNKAQRTLRRASINQLPSLRSFRLSNIRSQLQNIHAADVKKKAVSLVFPFGNGRIRGAMHAIPAAIFSVALVASVTLFALVTANLKLSGALDKVGLGQLVGLGEKHPWVDRYLFNGIDTILRNKAGGGNLAWLRHLSKPAVNYLALGNVRFFSAGWMLADVLLSVACFSLLTQRFTARKARNIALAAFGGQLAIKSLWGICRMALRSTSIGFAHTVVYSLAAAAAAALAVKSDQRAAVLIACVAAWGAINAVDAGAIWYLNH